EELVARGARALRFDRAVFGEEALHRLLCVLEVFAHEDLADERAAWSKELFGDGERAHEELEASRLVAETIARRARGHVAEDDIVRGVGRESVVLERERVALDEGRVGGERDLDRIEIDGEEMAF